jgi:hypothetical protein
LNLLQNQSNGSQVMKLLTKRTLTRVSFNLDNCILFSEIRDDLKAKYAISDEDYHWIEQMVIENTPHKAGPQWKFAGAFYFATVVLAMIGMD